MRRFAQAYLTIMAVIIILANLSMVVIYGRQFLFQATSELGCSQEGIACTQDHSQQLGLYIIMLNLLVIAIAFLIWLAIRRVYHRPSPSSIESSAKD